MSKKKNKRIGFNVAKRLQRKLAIAQGFYDGRFREKVVIDKKKEQNKKLARTKVTIDSETV